MQELLETYAISALPTLQVSLPWGGSFDATKIAVAIALFLLLSLLFKILQSVVLVYLRTLSARTSTDLDDVIIDAVASIRAWVYSLVALYVTLQLYTLPESVQTMVTAVFLFAIVWQAIEIITCFIDYGTQRLLEKDEDGDGVVDPNSANASHLVSLMGRIALWVFGAIFVLSNLGVEVTSLVAGLGIGGIAIAFALQGILADLFSSFSLYFDKPFRIGDYIIIGQDSGTVEKIGIKTTRIRTLQGEELVVSNAELTTARVQNFKKMTERRINFSFGITYETPYELVKSVGTMVEEIFKEVSGARLDRVHFTTFGDSALIYDVVFYVESAEYADYLDIQQQVNYTLMDRFAEKGIEFAYPTQTLYVKK